MANSSNPFDFSDFQSSGPDPRTQNSQNRDVGFGLSSSDRQDGGFDPFSGSNGQPPFDASVTASTSDGLFGQPLTTVGVPFDDEVVSPPIVWCALAGVAAVAGISLAFFGAADTSFAFAGWAVAGPLAIGLLAAHTLSDTKQRAKPFYSQPGWAAPVYWVVLALAFIGVGLCSWSIADWAGRL